MDTSTLWGIQNGKSAPINGFKDRQIALRIHSFKRGMKSALPDSLPRYDRGNLKGHRFAGHWTVLKSLKHALHGTFKITEY